ncbi:MAG: hypothetical protein Q7S11_00970 [bacterium]|nr:hypothetical protein [bacterium]
MKKEITLCYVPLSDKQIKRLKKENPERKFHNTKDLFCYIEDCFFVSVEEKYQGFEEGKTLGFKQIEWEAHRLFREYEKAKK